MPPLSSEVISALCIGFVSAIVPSSLIAYGVLRAIADSREKQARDAQAGNAREVARRRTCNLNARGE